MEGRNRLVVVRHGQTDWSRSGRHTGRTDLPLLEEGRAQAVAVGRRLRRGAPFGPFALVLSSPRVRAWDTCRLAGFAEDAQRTEDLAEWDYGAYEGRRTEEIRAERPSWSVWCDGAPGGESPAEVGARADRVVARARAAAGDVAAFGHGHSLRVVAARWLGLDPREGRRMALDAGTISVLGWERATPVVERWNDGGPWPTDPVDPATEVR